MAERNEVGVGETVKYSQDLEPEFCVVSAQSFFDDDSPSSPVKTEETSVPEWGRVLCSQQNKRRVANFAV